MEWFKHMGGTHKHPKMLKLIESKGLTGVGFYWSLCEVIAGKTSDFAKELSACLTMQQWADAMEMPPTTFRQFLFACNAAGLVDLTISTDNSGNIHSMYITINPLFSRNGSAI